MRGLYVLCVRWKFLSVCVYVCSGGRLQGVSLFKRMSACNVCLHEAIWNVRCVCVCVMRGFRGSCDYSRLLRCGSSGSVGPKESALYLACGNAHSAPLLLHCCSLALFFSFFN